ncbi:MAG TPA: hypothetical protein PK547_02125 [Candidatus Paceibacterota bacterium]|nr:hypothetical protein [Candidatus Paceibacterota bacterium]
MKEERHYDRLQAVILLIVLLILLLLMFGGHWGNFEKLPDISPGKDIVYEGINPPQEMLNNPNYIVGIIEEGGQKVYFIKERQKTDH